MEWNFFKANSDLKEEWLSNACDRLNSKFANQGIHFTWDIINSENYIIIDEILINDTWVIIYDGM